ncbi:hypothetical protein AB1Y20_017031 [Prymnesium parvum]|uniref:FLZ-type domain-containing protein n=1 Tax=Prymnesium parvum TaxID=97485 RepID=A0AB34I7R2_PRYPA
MAHLSAERSLWSLVLQRSAEHSKLRVLLSGLIAARVHEPPHSLCLTSSTGSDATGDCHPDATHAPPGFSKPSPPTQDSQHTVDTCRGGGGGTGRTEKSPCNLDAVDATPSTDEVFDRDETRAPAPDSSTARSASPCLVRNRSPGSPTSPRPQVSFLKNSPAEPCRTSRPPQSTAAAVPPPPTKLTRPPSSAALSSAPLTSAARASSPWHQTCAECGECLHGPSYMLNDRAYCSERHRLVASRREYFASRAKNSGISRARSDEAGLITSGHAPKAVSSSPSCGLLSQYKTWL